MEYPFYSPIDQALFDSRVIQVFGPVGSQLANEVNKQLLAMDKRDHKAPIYLFINSPGGEITSGFSIFDTAKFIRPPVFTVVVGLAASMGSLIALCVDKKRRVAFPNSKFLIHQPLISGVMHGSAADLEIGARDIVRTKQNINELYARETGKPIDVIREATDRDNWMTASEALEFGLISRIIGSREELDKLAI